MVQVRVLLVQTPVVANSNGGQLEDSFLYVSIQMGQIWRGATLASVPNVLHSEPLLHPHLVDALLRLF